MDKKFLIGIGVVALGSGLILYSHYQPIYLKNKVLKLFITKNYTSVSEQLTDSELRKLKEVIFNLTENEQKTLLRAYKNGSETVNVDELNRVLNKLKPVMDELKPSFDIKRIEYGKNEITLHIKNAIDSDIIFNYGGSDVKKIMIPMNKTGKDDTSMLKLVYDNGKLTAYEGNTKVQEETIIDKKQITTNNKPKT